MKKEELKELFNRKTVMLIIGFVLQIIWFVLSAGLITAANTRGISYLLPFPLSIFVFISMLITFPFTAIYSLICSITMDVFLIAIFKLIYNALCKKILIK